MSTDFHPAPEVGDEVAWARSHLASVTRDELESSPIPGGFSAARRALEGFSVNGYSRRRNDVWPPTRRGASGLSPYIRHGLLQLGEVWAHVEGGPDEDVERFRDELLWQEYARHLYARLGSATAHALRFSVPDRTAVDAHPWISEAMCIRESWTELVETGWLTNQQRMWLASHWAVRSRQGWRDGEDLFFRHLLDGSRAANRVGWQWTSGALTGKPYGFSRWQVEKRAPGLCAQCPLQTSCPIEQWPPEVPPEPRTVLDPRLRTDRDVPATRGPIEPEMTMSPELVWLTAESLGDADPALAAHPNLSAVFVFDAPLLQRVRVSGRRLVFLVQALADLATRRPVQIIVGDPVEVLAARALAVTFAPVPGFRRRAAQLAPAVLHPWPWLVEPHGGPLTSFTAWRRSRRR